MFPGKSPMIRFLIICGGILLCQAAFAPSFALLIRGLPARFSSKQSIRVLEPQVSLQLSSRLANHADQRYHYQEDFSSITFKQQTENTQWDSQHHALTLALHDQIRQQEAIITTNIASNIVYIVWRDLRNDDGDIYVQRIDAAGNRLWADDQRMNTDVGMATQFEPTAAVDASGNLWVAWVDNRNNNNDIFMQRMNPSGENLWATDRQINDDANHAEQGGASLTLLSDEKALIAWHDNRTGHDDIYTLPIDASGTAVWAHSLRVNSDATSSAQTYPAVATDINGEIVVAWLDQRVGNSDIYAQRMTADGHFIWTTEIQVNQLSEVAQSRPRVAINNHSETWIGWIASEGGHFYAQQVDAKGQLQRASALRISQVHEPVDANQPPALIAVTDGTFVAAWADSNRGFFYAQRFNGQGALLWPQEQQIHSYSPEKRIDRETISLAFTPNGLILAAWVDKRANSDGDIYSQALDLAGTRQSAQDVLINTQSGKVDQVLAATATDGSGEQVVVWQDWRDGLPALYLQRLTPDGKPLWSDHLHVSMVATQTGQLVADVATINTDTLIVWADNRSGILRLYAQRFDRYGNRQWPGDLLVSRAADRSATQLNPTLTTDQAGRIFVIWEEIKQGDKHLAMQQLGFQGSAVWASDLSIPTGANPFLPAIATGQDDNIYLSWIELVADEANLYLQRINASGQFAWANKVQVNRSSGEVNAYNPAAIGADSTGNVSVAWVNRSDSAIMTQRIDATGQPLWATDVKLNASTSAFAPLPDLAVLPSGETIVVWQQLVEQRYTIAAQRLDGAGNQIWQPNLPSTQAVIVSLQATDAQRPKIVTDLQGNSMIVWQDRRFKQWDVVAQQLSPSGTMIWPEDKLLVPEEKFYWAEGSVESKTIDQTDAAITSASVSAHLQQNGSGIAFWLSNNGGATWEPMQFGILHSFHTVGSDLRWKATLQANPNERTRTPVLQALTIDYDTAQAEFGDPYEIDDTCALARSLQINGLPQSHTLENNAGAPLDQDWVALTIAPNTQLTVIAQTQAHDTPLQLALHYACSDPASITTTSNVDGIAKITFTGTVGSVVYVQIRVDQPAPTQAIGYSLSAYTATNPGLAVIIAGHMPANPSLDGQIDQVAARAYRTLLAHGYTTSTLYFLSGNSQQDTNGDGVNDVDAPLSVAGIQSALEEWPRTFPKAQAASLLLFLIGQGEAGQFQATADQRITGEDLDLWLTNLENSSSVERMAIVLEMNQAGALIDGASQPTLTDQTQAGFTPTTLAHKNRIIVTATHDQGAACYTTGGALFSDIFWTALDQGASLWEAAGQARSINEQINYRCAPFGAPCQTPWLDDNGDAQANTTDDGALAHMWRLPLFTTPTGPLIQQVHVQPQASKSSRRIDAIMLRADEKTIVEAHILSPTYMVAAPTNGAPPVMTNPIIRLQADPLQPTTYYGVYDGFTEIGNYRVVVYAWNEQDVAAFPVVTNVYTGVTLYLPLIWATAANPAQVKP
ncbi:hypothetical protein BH10CHL1_BH10CHL1_20840 [soil metagenome]